MHAEITPYTHISDSDSPIARIDTLNEAITESIRKYFLSYGYTVYVNSPHETRAQYHVVAGDSYFVKSFLHSQDNANTERLVIVWDAYPEDMRMFSDAHVKIVLTDKKTFTDDDVQSLLKFYFTGKEKLLDVRLHKNQQHVVHPAVRQKHESAPDTLLLQPMEAEETKDAAQKIAEPVLTEKIREADVQRADRLRVASLVHEVYQPETTKKSGTGHRLGNLIAIAVTALFLPIIWYGIHILLSISAVLLNAELIRSGSSDTVPAIARVGLYGITQSSAMVPVLSLPFRIIRQEFTWTGGEQFPTVLENILKAEVIAGETIAASRELSASLLSPAGSAPDAPSPVVGIERVRAGMSSINQRLGIAEAMLTNLVDENRFPFSFAILARAGIRAHTELMRIRHTSTQTERLLNLYTQIAGFRETKTYLILFQNSSELRPTGGFIGSLALAHVRDGRLVDYTIQDVYDVDGQLKGHVDPPIPIRELLGQEHWYLRDSNWDPDFSRSGERAQWFYEKETGTRVDGVIALSVPFIVDILDVVGPIDLPDFNDRITAENFFGKSLLYTQNDFFPGSTQKKDFLGSLASALVLNITQNRRASPIGLYTAFVRALQRRDILMYFSDQESQALASSYGWSGEIRLDAGCPYGSNACVPHGLAIIDANVSVNKVNYFVKTSRIRLVDISVTGDISETVTINYRNTSRGDERGGGIYRNYARIFLPQEAIVDAVALDGVPIEEKKVASDSATTPLPYWEYDSLSPFGPDLGIAFDVPAGQERKLTLSYRRMGVLPVSEPNMILSIYDYKQPGVTDTEEEALIRYPLSFVATVERIEGGSVQTGNASGLFLAKHGQLEYNTTLSSDFLLRMVLKRQ